MIFGAIFSIFSDGSVDVSRNLRQLWLWSLWCWPLSCHFFWCDPWHMNHGLANCFWFASDSGSKFEIGVSVSAPRSPVHWNAMQLQWHDINHLLLAIPLALTKMAVAFQPPMDPAEMAREACTTIMTVCGRWDGTKTIGYLWCALTALRHHQDEKGEFFGDNFWQHCILFIRFIDKLMPAIKDSSGM